MFLNEIIFAADDLNFYWKWEVKWNYAFKWGLEKLINFLLFLQKQNKKQDCPKTKQKQPNKPIKDETLWRN